MGEKAGGVGRFWRASRTAPDPDGLQWKASGEPALLRLVAPLALILVAGIVVCGAAGFLLARQADDRLDAERRGALRAAIAALQMTTPDLTQIAPARLELIEQASGLRGLRFEADIADGGRDVQSVVDGQGRIVGWFSWEGNRPATAVMRRLLPFAVVVALSFVGFALLARWQLHRLRASLARSDEHVRRLEREDLSTGLPNHPDLLDRLGAALSACGPDESLAVAVIDLNSFGEVKDSVGGESAGEHVVHELVSRVGNVLPPHVTLARLRNERFALLMPSTDPQQALALAEAARDAFCGSVRVNYIVQISASIGVAVAPRDGATRDELMRRAKLALRTARRRGRGTVLAYTPEMEVEFDERQFIRRELAGALASRAFDLHYQPIVKANGGAVVGVEALLRWQHPVRGFIPPAAFVRVAEEAGLMDQLGEFVLRRALSDAARWPDLYVAVNLSPVQVRDGKFVELVATLLEEAKFEPSRLMLEITEGVLIDDPDLVKSRLEDLRALGVRLALDDFGAGYSSLAYLQRLPFDKLKIDRGFVAALDQWANTGVIIQAIVALGRALGMSVLIEGVETEEQRVLLRLAGCNEMQGFLFARPAPPEAIDRLMAGKNSTGGTGTRSLRSGT